MRSRKEEMSYETVCVAQKIDHNPSQEYLNEISSVIKQQSKQIEDLTKEVQRKDNYNYNSNRQRDVGPKQQLQMQPKQQSQSQMKLQQNPQPQQQQGLMQGNRNWNRNPNKEFRPRSQSQDSRQGTVREGFYCGQAGHIRRFCQKYLNRARPRQDNPPRQLRPKSTRMDQGVHHDNPFGIHIGECGCSQTEKCIMFSQKGRNGNDRNRGRSEERGRDRQWQDRRDNRPRSQYQDRDNRYGQNNQQTKPRMAPKQEWTPRRPP